MGSTCIQEQLVVVERMEVNLSKSRLTNADILEFSINVSMNTTNSVTKIFVITVKGLKLAISCVRDQHATIAPTRHMLETRSFN